MYPLFVLSVLLASAHSSVAGKSSGCRRPKPLGLTQGGTGKSNALTFDTTDGTQRQYLLHIPENYNPNTPAGLIFAYAGRGESVENHESTTQLSEPSYNPNDIVVYPKAYAPWNSNSLRARADRWARASESIYNEEEHQRRDESGGNNVRKAVWQGDPEAQTNNIQFTLELLDHIEDTFCIDVDRVFASGMSNGGGFVANILACDPVASGRFAAFAASSGAYYQKNAGGDCAGDTAPIQCNNVNTKLPLIFVAGGSDNIIGYEGGPRRGSCLPSVPRFVTSWAERDGLITANVSTQIPYIDGAMHYSFGQGPDAGMVQSYYIPKLGHMWAQEANSHFDATRVFVDFFARWNLASRQSNLEPSVSTDVAISSTLLPSVSPSYDNSASLSTQTSTSTMDTISASTSPTKPQAFSISPPTPTIVSSTSSSTPTSTASTDRSVLSSSTKPQPSGTSLSTSGASSASSALKSWMLTTVAFALIAVSGL